MKTVIFVKWVEPLICKDSQLNTMKKKEKNTRAKILLIDEVDVFFSREFYGNIYTPSIVFGHNGNQN
jgi:hypothetical protein